MQALVDVLALRRIRDAYRAIRAAVFESDRNELQVWIGVRNCS
jgi:hypothetical protein